MLDISRDMQDLIGSAVNRVDAHVKVSGTARFAAEHILPGLAQAVVVQSTIARGRIQDIETAAALSLPGVLDVITWRNADRLCLLESNPQNRPGQTYLVLQDDQIRYYGQHLAVVVAETREQAQYAATLLKIRYSVESSNTDLSLALDQQIKPKRITLINAPEVDTGRGDAEKAFQKAPVCLDLLYTTPIENQNAMEPHASVASWYGDSVQLIDSTQWVLGTRNMVATHLGLTPDKVRVISQFVGGGFGSKGNPWPHPTLAAMAARRLNRPVRLVFGREQMFSQVGHRPATRQHLCIGADRDGHLQSLSHHVVSGTSQFDHYVESSATTSRVSYSCPNVVTTHRVVPLDTNTPCPMRGPGEATGSFALESAMDELAYKVQIDPLELRLRNYAEQDEDRNKPFSSKSLKECYAVAAERFGWQRRPLQPRSMRQGFKQTGWGMASAIFLVKLSPASARVRLYPDGSAVIFSATHEIGTGTYTALAQVAARELQIQPERVRFELGDTEFPSAPASAGSQTAASVGSAVVLAAREAIRQIILLAVQRPESPLYGVAQTCVKLQGPHLVTTDGPARNIPWATLLKSVSPDRGFLETECTWTPPSVEERSWSGWSFGAHFCEVDVDESLGQVYVRRWVAAFAAGRILNEKTARSQLQGGIVWGVSQALWEKTIHDDHSGGIVNPNLAEYLIPVNADVPFLDVSLVAEHDQYVNPLGAKGLGELGICGASAAVANAVYHATGVRFRNLPITADQFLRT